jgi:DDE superfamily endonuclease
MLLLPDRRHGQRKTHVAREQDRPDISRHRILAALRNDRIDAPCLFDGPINGERLHTYVEQFLVPTLKAGDVVILDNLGSHQGRAVRKAIRDVRGAPRVPAEILSRPQPHRAGLAADHPPVVGPSRSGLVLGQQRPNGPPHCASLNQNSPAMTQALQPDSGLNHRQIIHTLIEFGAESATISA